MTTFEEESTMKHPVWLFIFFAVGLVVPANAQELTTFEGYCSYNGEPLDEAIYSFPADQEAQAAVDRILRIARLPQNFTLKAANVPNVAAVVHGDKRLLLYNQYFIRQTRIRTREGWASLRVLSHEIGHHLLHHALMRNGNRALDELAADRFSGYILAELRASRQEVEEVLADAVQPVTSDESSNTTQPTRPPALPPHPGGQIGSDNGSPPEPQPPALAILTHPARALRFSALMEGFDQALDPSQHTFDHTWRSSSPIPSFPWPPPKASAFTPVDLDRATTDGHPAELKDLADRLENALAESGYGERSYYAVPDGFALVSRLEQINEDGTPKKAPDRWSMNFKPLSHFSLTAYFKALFTAAPGHFRIIVFVVSPHPFSQEDVDVNVADGQAWLAGGLNALPDEIGRKRVQDDHRCTALIYEFEQQPSEARVFFKDPSPVTGKMHLTRTHLWQRLVR